MTRRECEIKIRIDGDESQKKLIDCLSNNGFTYNNCRLETDYILGVVDRECDNILLRIREIAWDFGSRILFTLKIKGSSAQYQDYTEIEYMSGSADVEDANALVDSIMQYMGVSFSRQLLLQNDVKIILRYLESKDIAVRRIYQKRRCEYIGNNSKAMVDVFPEPIGSFLEIEADNEEALINTIHLLSIEKCSLEKRDYGQIIRELSFDNNMVLF